MMNMGWISIYYIFLFFNNISFFSLKDCFSSYWVLIAVHKLSLVAESRTCVLHSVSFSLQWLSCGAQAVGTCAPVVAIRGPVVVACGLKKSQPCSCGTQALLLHNMWEIPKPGMELYTTRPLGKPPQQYFVVLFGLQILYLICPWSNMIIILFSSVLY